MALAFFAKLFSGKVGKSVSPVEHFLRDDNLQSANFERCRDINFDMEKENNYILVIHGTFDALSEEESTIKWYFMDQDDPSNFCNRLKTRLVELFPDSAQNAIWRSLPEELPVCHTVPYPFHWDGTNTHRGRIEAAAKLAKLLHFIGHKDPGARVHIIAHSHGGNVALKALELYMADLAVKPESELSPSIRKRFWRAYSNTFEIVGQWRKVKSVGFWWLWPFLVVRRKINGEITKGLESYPFAYYRWMDHILGLGYFRQQTYTHHRKASSPLTNCVGGIVFLGTPFYVRTWSRNGALWLAVHVTCVTLVACVFLYFYGAFWLFVFFNFGRDWESPQYWVYRSVFGGILAAAVVVGVPVTMLRDFVFSDGNFYHSARYQWSNAMSALVVNAGMLDEAALVLSGQPLVEVFLLPQLKELFQSTIWRTKPTYPNYISFWTVARYIFLWIWAIFINAIFVFPLILQRVLIVILLPYFGKQLEKLIVSMSYGLKPLDFNFANIYVDQNLHDFKGASQDIQHWNVQRLLAAHKEITLFQKSNDGNRNSSDCMEGDPGNRRPSLFDSECVYSFLWDDSELEKKCEASVMYKHLRNKVDKLHHNPSMTRSQFEKEMKRLCVMFEERFAEITGRLEFSHGVYFRNEAIIRGIAEFLARHKLPSWADENDSISRQMDTRIDII